MKIKKINYNFSIDQIIENSLSVQSIQKNLKDKFGISNPNLTIFKNPNFPIKEMNPVKNSVFTSYHILKVLQKFRFSFQQESE